jgi:Glycosyl hydrolases family 28
MKRNRANLSFSVCSLAAALLLLYPEASSAGRPAGAGEKTTVFNVRDFGATGRKPDFAGPAIQKAVDACAAAGGGMVYLPPGDYTSGTIHLRSHVRFHIEAGATVYSVKDKTAFDKEALFFGEDLVNITLEGRGTVNGEAAYERRPRGDFQDDFIYPNQVEMEKLGLPLIRSFPRTDQAGKLVLLLRCRDVRITGLSFIDSPSWTIHPYGCERLVIDGVYIRSSLKDGVWADGIDPDGCRDLRIANSTIETGDDALVFYSMNWFGPALPCENITVTNCRLSSASSAIKFCDGNMNAIRRVTIDNCVITDSNRGLAFMNFDGGEVTDVIISNLTIDCRRHEWFWWGDGEPFHFNIRKRSEVHKNWKKADDRPAGVIRNVLIRDIIARGRGASVCNGHPESWLEGITMDNVKLFIAHDPAAPYDKAVDALTFRQVKNLKLRNLEVIWEGPAYDRWRSALLLEDVSGLEVQGFSGGPAAASRGSAAVILNQVEDALIRQSRASGGTKVFLDVRGDRSRGIAVWGNDVRNAEVPLRTASEVPPGGVTIRDNLGKTDR